jgi:DNA processing protein
MTDALDRLRLARTEGVGPITYRRLLRRYRSAAEAIAALPALARAGGRASAPVVPPPGAAERELERVRKLGCRLLFLDTPDYPPLLALLDDAPPVVTVMGAQLAFAPRAVAMVGSRNASVNGQRIAEALAEELAAAGLAVVSGLARGIDAAAHEGALRGGLTIACVAGGIDVPYPPEHARLQQRIVDAGGAIVAEMPPGTAPQSRLFIRRNRVIAGLSLGVVVVEAATRSGALVTARIGQDANRELFAVPGSPLDPRCRGTNDLIRQGAHLVETAADIVAHLPDHPAREGLARLPEFARGSVSAGLSEETGAWLRLPLFDAPDSHSPDSSVPETSAHDTVLQLLSPSPTSVDDLLRRCQLSPATVQTALLDLELAGRVEFLAGSRVALLSEPGP